MKRAAILSGILHVLILIFMIVGITDPFSRNLEDQKPLIIDFVDISDITKAPVIAPLDVNEPEPAVEAPQQEPQQTPLPPVEQPPQPAPQPEPTPPPPAPTEQPQPQPEPVKQPEPEAMPLPSPKKEEPKKPEPKKEEKKPEPKPEEPKKQEPPKKEKVEVNLKKDQPKAKKDDSKEKKKVDDAFDNLLSDVVKDSKKKDTTKTSGRTKGAPAEQVGEVVTASEIDAIRRNFEPCWIVPNGVRGVRNLQVKINIEISKEGKVLKARTVDRGRMATDPVFRAAAESAERAATDPKCSTLKLDPAKYSQWKSINITFDPETMQ
ncbi:MAG: hypothetical protein KF820_02800 [Candidatus Paracaedibacteraceae bacterium]|nr:hypothetical protein [Candidatus Paracaedibacteraceae bacterium]